MPIKSSLAQFESPIIALSPLEGSLLAIVTANHEIYLYNTLTQTQNKLIRLNISSDAKLLCAFDPFHMRMVFGTNQSKTLNMIDLNQKKIIRRFELDQQCPTAITFDPEGEYLICGTDEGRVLLWRSDSKTLIARMHSYPEYTTYSTIKEKSNFVSALTFEGNTLATSGYGGSIVLTDYRSQTYTHRLHPGHIRNGALLFYKGSLIVGNQSGTLLKLDQNTKYPNQRLATSLGPITHLLQVGPDPFILVVSQQRNVLLIDGDRMQIIQERYIELDDSITAVSKDQEGQIYIGTEKGELCRFDLEPVKPLKSLISSKAYGEAYRYCLQEPLLQKSQMYEQLESIFEKEMVAARIAFEKGENEKARAILFPFNAVKSKEISALSAAFAQINRLTLLFKQQKFSPFYGLIEQYPLLRSTSLFSHAEKLWTEQFSKAQKLMLIGKVKEARTELQPFSTVSAKGPFIQLLLQHIEVLKSYSKALHSRDYRTLKQLGQRYLVIRKLPSYLQFIAEAGELVPAITEALKTKAFERANLLLDELCDVSQYEKNYEELKQFASLASNLSHAIDHEHWRSAYRLIDSHRELMILPWAQELENNWQQKLQQCETYAIRGDIASIKKELSTLITLPNRHERIGNILRTAYHVQLRQMFLEHPETFPLGITNYCDLFGMDTELRHILKAAEEQGVTLILQPMQFQTKNRDLWLNGAAMLPEHIA